MRKLWKYIQKKNKLLKVFAFLYNLLMFNKLKVNRKNRIENQGAFIKKTKILIKGKSNLVILEPGVRLNNCIINMSGDNAILHIKKGTYVEKQKFHFEDVGSKIVIGENCILNGGEMAAVEDNKKISIGEQCLFSSNVHIVTTDSHSILDINTKERINRGEDVVVGDRVWITASATLLKGSTIANGSVVGRNTVVTKKFNQENCVIAGNPGRVIRENIEWKAERI